MKKTLSIITIIAILVLLASCDFLNGKPEPSMTSQTPSITTSQSTNQTTEETTSTPTLDIASLEKAQKFRLNTLDVEDYFIEPDVVFDDIIFYRIKEFDSKAAYLEKLFEFFTEDSVNRTDKAIREQNGKMYVCSSKIHEYDYQNAKSIEFYSFIPITNTITFHLEKVPIKGTDKVQDIEVMIEKSTGKIEAIMEVDFDNPYGGVV